MKASQVSIRTNDDWLADLRQPGPARETALADLSTMILKGLPYALAGWLRADDPQFQALCDDVAQETLMRVLDHLHTFEGRSQFVTWVHKIAVRVALTELRRRKWRDVSLDALMEDARGSAALQASGEAARPGRAAEQANLMALIERIMHEELTDKQLRAMMAVGNLGMPLEEVARRLGTERNALYKLLHDARLRLKRRLAREGLTVADILAAFERG